MWKEAIQIEDKNAKEVVIKLMQEMNELKQEVNRLKREKIQVPIQALGKFQEYIKVDPRNNYISYRKGKYLAQTHKI